PAPVAGPYSSSSTHARGSLPQKGSASSRPHSHSRLPSGCWPSGTAIAAVAVRRPVAPRSLLAAAGRCGSAHRRRSPAAPTGTAFERLGCSRLVKPWSEPVFGCEFSVRGTAAAAATTEAAESAIGADCIAEGVHIAGLCASLRERAASLRGTLLLKQVRDAGTGLHAGIPNPCCCVLTHRRQATQARILIGYQLAQECRAELCERGLCVAAAQSSGGGCVLEDGVGALLLQRSELRRVLQRGNGRLLGASSIQPCQVTLLTKRRGSGVDVGLQQFTHRIELALLLGNTPVAGRNLCIRRILGRVRRLARRVDSTDDGRSGHCSCWHHSSLFMPRRI